ncbi:hypothetical protein E2562_003149 [Oryza meyeriana var. granulata]|uniref:Uncharacterized protein n=1 Tax=Oryza meyeriana var. granulata TaxID=110450 RepID=A0A6G1E9V0_9ORYZ|nr:hypothetical protein E2562_003149 [Oryza meyeriana var. granulata]
MPRGTVGRSSGCRRSVPGTADGGQLTLALDTVHPSARVGAMALQDPSAPRRPRGLDSPRSLSI